MRSGEILSRRYSTAQRVSDILHVVIRRCSERVGVGGGGGGRAAAAPTSGEPGPGGARFPPKGVVAHFTEESRRDSKAIGSNGHLALRG